jgi:hypothetical protein
MQRPMTDAKYRSLLWELIAASDRTRYDVLTVEDVQSRARAGTISRLLADTIGATADFSFLSDDDWASLNYEEAAMMSAEDATWTFIAKKKGISLLMAFALQGVEQNIQPARPHASRSSARVSYRHQCLDGRWYGTGCALPGKLAQDNQHA